MELVIERYTDGSCMIFVDDKRYYVWGYKAVSFGAVGDTMERMPARAFCYSCEEVQREE